MTTLHATNSFNVEATLNAWLETTLGAFTKPMWLQSYHYILTVPETTLVCPAFSVHHIPVMQRDLFQGRNGAVGERVMDCHGIMEVNIWVARSDYDWDAQRRTMEAMVRQAVLSNPQVVIKDYLTAPTSPSTTLFKVNIGEVEIAATAPDPNPDIERKRIMIHYQWLIRS